jgi:hypothetical protein
MTLEELSALRDKMAKVEKQVLEDITAKAKLLGFELVLTGSPVPRMEKVLADRPKRKRRTKAEIEAERALMPTNEL